MWFQCWATVCDAGPTLKPHWVNASCLLGCPVKTTLQVHPVFFGRGVVGNYFTRGLAVYPAYSAIYLILLHTWSLRYSRSCEKSSFRPLKPVSIMAAFKFLTPPNSDNHPALHTRRANVAFNEPTLIQRHLFYYIYWGSFWAIIFAGGCLVIHAGNE